MISNDARPIGALCQQSAIHRDAAFARTMSAAVEREIRDLADWLEPDLTLPC